MQTVLKLTAVERAQLYQAASQELGIGEIIIEKDFWVCWTLHQLFCIPELKEHLLFKGGTSLSKVWKVITRFSEDIDLSIGRDWLGFSGENDPEEANSNTRSKNLIEKLKEAGVTKVAEKILPALQACAQKAFDKEKWSMRIDTKDPMVLRFVYPSAMANTGSSKYIDREVKIEFSSRSDDWPAEDKTVVPYIQEAYPEVIKDSEVQVHVLSIGRTFWEKATILHSECYRPQEKDLPGKYSRHYADLAALADHSDADAWLKNEVVRKRVVEHKSHYFRYGWDRYDTAVPGSFRLVPSDYRLPALEADYGTMAQMYFKTPRPWKEIIQRLKELEEKMNHINHF